MIYIFLGEDHLAKDQKIAEIKKKFLTLDFSDKGSFKDALQFDYEVLYGNELDSEVLKKALLALPVIAQKRIIVLHALDKLNLHNRRLVLEFIKEKFEHSVLILDSHEADLNHSFINQIAASAQVIHFQKDIKQNVFDMTKAISLKKPAQALSILSSLLLNGNHPLQIMGGLIWFWGKSKGRLSKEGFQKGLKILQEADLDIKRSRLNPQYALEKLIVKLCALIAY